MHPTDLAPSLDRPSHHTAIARADTSQASADTAMVAGSSTGHAESASTVTSSEISDQKRASTTACLQSDQRYIRDPLPMPPESGKVDAAPATDSGGADKDSSSLGLSQVLGKILQQLSISAWVPAAMLVGNGTVLLQLHADASYNIARAVMELTGKPLGTIIILAFALVLTTAVTQAFEFEVIRFLEGYFDSTIGPIQAIMAWRIQRHEAKRDRFERMLGTARTNAREQAAKRMENYKAYSSEELAYLAKNPPKGSAEFDEALDQRIRSITWKHQVPSAAQYRVDSIQARLDSYPAKHRLLPTRLGNVLRASEDTIKLTDGENLEGYVVRHHDQLPAALQSEHKDYRTRLDMYCCLTLAFSMLAVISGATLYNVSPLWGMAIAVVAYVLMACLSYQAAIATARSYGLILREIHQYLAKQASSGEAAESSALGRLLSLLHRNTV